MGTPQPPKIPCVYIGAGPLRLSADHGPYHDGDGKPLKNRDVLPGHTLMMSAEEVNGVTFWHDPRGILPSQKLGVGRVVKAEHQGLDMDTLLALGYDFADGRTDFVTVEQQAKAETDQATASPHVVDAEDATPAPITAIPLPPETPVVTPEPTPPPAPAQTQTPTPPSSGWNMSVASSAKHEEQDENEEVH